MRVRLRFERIYGTISRYGENPRESPFGSPILLDNYPLLGERVTIYLGQPVEELYRTYNIARAGGFTLVRRNFVGEAVTDAEEKAVSSKPKEKVYATTSPGGIGT